MREHFTPQAVSCLSSQSSQTAVSLLLCRICTLDTGEDAHSPSSKSCHLWLLKAKTWLKLYTRALCHMAFGSIKPRLLDKLNIPSWRQITTLVESSGLPPRTNASIKHPARPGAAMIMTMLMLVIMVTCTFACYGTRACGLCCCELFLPLHVAT